MDKHTICLLNDSFPPIIDGVANAVVNYAENIEKHHGHAVVVTPAVPGADDSGFPFPVVRYPSIDTRRLVGYVAGYPFSPETALRVREEKVELLHTHCPIASAILARSLREVVDAPLVLTYHTKYDIDIAKAVKSRLLQESAIRALVQNVNACDEVWVVSRGAGENLRSLGYEGAYTVMENGVDVPRGRVSAAAVAAATAGYDLPDGVPLLSVTKGIERGTHLRMSQVIAQETGGEHPIAVLSGPSHAEEVARAMPTGVVAASNRAETAELVQRVFTNERFRVYTHDDMVGVELAGALKNVAALCCGVSDGLGLGDNTKALLITRAMAETSRLAERLGGRKETLAGLAGMGDLIVTCTSMHSRNRRAGIAIGEGRTPQEVVADMGGVVEGYYAAVSAKELADSLGVEMPICEAMYDILYNGAEVRGMVHRLMSRAPKRETDNGWV